MTTENKVYKFTDRNTAISFANHATKIMMIVLGDDDKFWVCTPADAARLVKQGYEYAD
jgi:hypothetical protein